MSNENEPPDLFKLPVSQKDAWNYAFKAGLLAAYFWALNHFVSNEQHEKDLSKIDARQAMLENTLAGIDRNVTKVTQQMEDERRYQSSHP